MTRDGTRFWCAVAALAGGWLSAASAHAYDLTERCSQGSGGGALVEPRPYGACDIDFPDPFTGQEHLFCPSVGFELVFSSPGSYELDPSCRYTDVKLRVTASDVVVDCNGARLDNDARDRDAVTIGSRLHDVTVRNCFVHGYEKGVRISGGVSASQKDELYNAFYGYADDLERRHRELTWLYEEIRETATRAVRLENVHVRESGHTGIYVTSFVHDSTLDGVSSWGNGNGPGIYLDAGSRGIEVRRACLSHSAREGIAVDSSANNVIRDSRFEYNRLGGILLYKNANESLEKGHLPRSQHSSGNLISGNLFWHEKRGVWIASRAAKNYSTSSLTYADPVVFSNSDYVYRRDYAESNRVVDNVFLESCMHAVVVEDDHTMVSGNHFSSIYTGDTGIYLGSRPRQWIGDPIYDTVIVDNVFDVNVRYNVEQSYCATGSYFANNRVDHGSYLTDYVPGPPACSDARDRGKLNPALIAAAAL